MPEKKHIRKTLKICVTDGDLSKVSVTMRGAMFDPAEFTGAVMAVIETYTAGMIENEANTKEAVYDHWNGVFGIFLNKILPEDEIYARDAAHGEYKGKVDAVLGGEGDSDMNRIAAMGMVRDILTDEMGLTEESADAIISKRLEGKRLHGPKEA